MDKGKAARRVGGMFALVVSILVTVAMADSACAPAEAPKLPSLDVRWGLTPATASAALLVPIDDGEFASRGLNISVQAVTDTAQTMISVASGQFEFGTISMGSAALNAFNRGADLKIIASGGTEPSGHGSIVPVIVRTQLMDSGAVKTAADLKGRKIAINGRGVISEYALAKALATGSLTPNDVDVQIMPFPEMVAALTTGAIDAGLILQPTGAQAVAKGIGKILLDDYNQNAQIAVVVANTRFLEQHRPAVTSLLEVYVQAQRRLSNGKLKGDDRALAVLQKYTNIPPDVIRLAPDPYWPPDARVMIDSLQDEQRFFMGSNSLDYSQPLDVQKLIDYGPLDSALKNIGG